MDGCTDVEEWQSDFKVCANGHLGSVHSIKIRYYFVNSTNPRRLFMFEISC